MAMSIQGLLARAYKAMRMGNTIKPMANIGFRPQRSTSQPASNATRIITV
jgi:hypothetical protein